MIMSEASSQLARYDRAVLTVGSDAVVVRRHEGDGGAERRRVEPWRINGSSMFDDGQKISPSGGNNVQNSDICLEVPSEYVKPRSRQSQSPLVIGAEATPAAILQFLNARSHQAMPSSFCQRASFYSRAVTCH